MCQRTLISFILAFCVCFSVCFKNNKDYNDVFSWRQLGYDFNGMHYRNSTNFEYKQHAIHFIQELNDSEKFFIQNNNVPIGFEVYEDTVFITVPRRRHGERKQVQPPAIIIYDLKTNQEILRHEINRSAIINERTTGGLTSITVDVLPNSCDDAYAYINDLATEGLVVFSLKDRESWRLDHQSFRHDEQAMNFSAAGHVITWRDGLFSIALSPPDDEGRRKAYYHPLVSTEEFSVDTAVLKNKRGLLDGEVKHLGSRGPNSQSGSHDTHPTSGAVFFANVAQDAVMCWNLEKGPDSAVVVVQDRKKLAYVSDLKVVGDEVWALTNQIPRFIFNTQNKDDDNYFIQRYKIFELLKGTACEKTRKTQEK